MSALICSHSRMSAEKSAAWTQLVILVTMVTILAFACNHTDSCILSFNSLAYDHVPLGAVHFVFPTLDLILLI